MSELRSIDTPREHEADPPEPDRPRPAASPEKPRSETVDGEARFTRDGESVTPEQRADDSAGTTPLDERPFTRVGETDLPPPYRPSAEGSVNDAPSAIHRGDEVGGVPIRASDASDVDGVATDTHSSGPRLGYEDPSATYETIDTETHGSYRDRPDQAVPAANETDLAPPEAPIPHLTDGAGEAPDHQAPDRPAEQDDQRDAIVDGDIVCVIDGDEPALLACAEQQEFEQYRDQLAPDRTRPADDVGPEYDYQRTWCGAVEYRITPDEDLPRGAWADGLNSDRGLAQDAKHVEADARSWFVPDSLPPTMRAFARESMDQRLIKYRDAIMDQSNPLRGLEIVTNNAAAAEHIAGRMNVLKIPGIVRVRR